MKKAYFWLFVCIAALFGGCSSKGEPAPAKQEANATQKQEVNTTKAASSAAGTKKAEANKTIKRTNITVNNFSDCPSSTPSDYKTIPYE